MAKLDELRRTLSTLTARNIEISGLLNKMQSGRRGEDAQAREAALRKELESNEELIRSFTDEMKSSQ